MTIAIAGVRPILGFDEENRLTFLVNHNIHEALALLSLKIALCSNLVSATAWKLNLESLGDKISEGVSLLLAQTISLGDGTAATTASSHTREGRSLVFGVVQN